MNTLNTFLCDWGSPDSNMLLFFLLISFLLGLLAGWLIWGRKIQAMLEQVKERDATILDLNGKLNIKEAELSNANKSVDELMAKNRTISEEKGQLTADLMSVQNEVSDLKVMAALLPERDNTIEKLKMELANATESLSALTEKWNIENDNNTKLSADLSNCRNELEALKANTSATEANVMLMTNLPEDEEAMDIVAIAAATDIKPDDLKIVEGIGPKIEGILNNAGIMTFRQLAAASIEQLKELLLAAGNRYKIHDPSTWARQAQLAHEGKWEELKIWQDELNGGKE
jgi:predicted flap endonuclease-1-like 5' DNA nuclease